MKEDIVKLREMTGAGIIDCKNALEESQGDFDKALALIKERGLAKVEKRAGRQTGAGIIVSYVHAERIGSLLDIRAETDFVVKSEPFKNLAREIVMHIAAMAPADVEELLKQPYVKDEKKTVSDLVNEVIAIVGENIQINSFSRLEL